jgi:hypothetical protein
VRARVAVTAFALFSAAAGCSFLVDFTDAPPDADVAFDAAFDVESPDAGPVSDGETNLDGGDAAPNPCAGKADGYNYNPADTYARCCDAGAVRTVTDDECGTCGIKCNTAKGQKCQLAGPHYYCRGCEISSDCWSNCCSLEFGTGLCAASNCTTGACDPALCKGGTRCVTPGDASNYCSYN